MASLAGPALGGRHRGPGLTVTYGVDVASFASLSSSTRCARLPAPDAEPPSLRTIREGCATRPRARTSSDLPVDMNAMFFGMPMALFPAIAKGYGGPEVSGCSTRRRRPARSS